MPPPEVPPQPHLNRRRSAGLAVFAVVLIGFGLVKAQNEGRFEPRLALDLGGQPALVFFTLRQGCDCQMQVVGAAEAQLSNWTAPAEAGIALVPVDFDRRPDLARQYGVVRAPALVLLDTQGQVAWKQDRSLSDAAPLDLAAAEAELRLLRAVTP